MRFKKRYLLYAIEGQKLDEKSVRSAVRSAVYYFLGEKGSSEANARFLAFNEKDQRFLLACALNQLENVIAALAFYVVRDNGPIALRLQKISGSAGNLWKEKA